jgi:hypothetical protein
VTCDYAHLTERGWRTCSDAGGYRIAGRETCLSHYQRLRAAFSPEDPEGDAVGGFACETCGRIRRFAAFPSGAGGVPTMVCRACRGVEPLAVPVREDVSAATGGAARVLAVLWSRADEAGRVRVTVAAVTSATGLTRRGAQKALRRLERTGDVVRVEIGRADAAGGLWRLVRRCREGEANRVRVLSLPVLGELRAVHRAAVYGTLGPSGITERLGAILAKVEGEDG